MDRLPKYQDLIHPMVRVLQRSGKPLSNQEIEAGVISELSIPKALSTAIHAGARTELQYRLAWARTKAKAMGLIKSPSREIWEITEPSQESSDN